MVLPIPPGTVHQKPCSAIRWKRYSTTLIFFSYLADAEVVNDRPKVEEVGEESELNEAPKKNKEV